MALRTCWKIAAVCPRFLWRSTIFSEACFLRGQSYLSSLVNSHTGCPRTRLTVCSFSSTPVSTDVSYEELKQILAEKKAVVIDVREPWELREYGYIPGSMNVPPFSYYFPVGQINTALQLCAEEFEEKYGGEMPLQTDNIVFTCLAGVRSKTALDTATSLGYKSVQHFPGGWQDWVENEKK